MAGGSPTIRCSIPLLLLVCPLLVLPGAASTGAAPDALVILETPTKATLLWSANGAPIAHDVFGFVGGLREHLGTAPPGANTFVAPPGYDAYVVRAVLPEADERAPCLRVIATLPPQVRIIPACSSSGQVGRGLASLP